MAFAKIIEMSAESESSFDDAVRQGAEKASRTLENVDSMWVKNQEVSVQNGKVQAYRVHLKVTFQVN